LRFAANPKSKIFNLKSAMNLDATKKAEFDRLLTAATVFRRRGDYVQATQTIKQALAISPDDITAREFAADMLYAHGDLELAAEHYKSILEAEPGRPSAEEKYAKAILELAEGQRQRELIQLMVENPGKFRPIQQKNSALAVLLTIAPGLGHMYCGQYVQGIVIFVVWVLACVFFAFSLDTAASAIQRVTTTSVIFACLAGSIHIYALLGAAQAADKTRSGKDKDPSEPQ
jgi:tetratricopeptide (TPR) repeat protein